MKLSKFNTPRGLTRFARRALGAGLLGWGLLAGSARAEFGFTEREMVSGASSSYAPVAAAGGSAFVSVYLTGSAIEFVRSLDNGSTWSAPQSLLGQTRGGTWNATIDSDGAGNWVVVWTAKIPGDPGNDVDLLSARSTDNGATWTGPVAVNSEAAVDGGAYDITPVLKSDRAGRWLAVWRHDAFAGPLGVDDDLLYSISTDNGATWSAQAPLNKSAASDTGFDNEPRIGMDGSGNWVVVWQSNESFGGVLGNDVDILYARSSDSGATWSNPLPLNPSAGLDSVDDIHPEIGVSAAGVWLATWRDDQFTRILRSTNGGRNWTALPNLPVTNVAIPISLGGSDWLRDAGYLGISRDDGQTWSDAYPTTDNQEVQVKVELAGEGGRIVEVRSTGAGVWVRHTDTWRDEYAAKMPYSYAFYLNRSTFDLNTAILNQGLKTWNPADGIIVQSTSDPCGLLAAPVSVAVNNPVAPGDSFQVHIDGFTPPIVGECGIGFQLVVPTAAEPVDAGDLRLFFTGYDAEFVSMEVPEVIPVSGAFHVFVTMKNKGNLTWSPDHVDMAGLTGCAITTSTLTAPVGTGQIGVFDVAMRAPDEETVCAFHLNPRFKLDAPPSTRYGLFGPTVDGQVIVSNRTTVFNLTTDREGWIGGSIQGEGFAGASDHGVCMYVPDSGDNVVGWVSPERMLPLVDMRVTKVTVAASSTQSAVDSIPLWDVSYDNFNTSGYGSNYGGEAWIMDVAGGANGVSRNQGRTEFTIFAAPNAMLTPQWRGTLGGGAVGSSGGAFTAEADAFNDMRLIFRVLDLGSAAINANQDSGTICVSHITTVAVDYGQITSSGLAWGPAISSATHAAQTLEQSAENAGTAQIDDTAHAALYQLTAQGPGSRKTLVPYDPTQATTLAALYPVAWTSNAVYRGTTLIQSNVGGGAGPEGSDPVDTVFLNFDTTNSELGFLSFTSRGSAGNMLFAASPRLASTAGGPQAYVAFFSGQNRTLSEIVDSDRLRLQSEFFNTAQIAPEGSGADPVAIVGTSVDTVVVP